MIEQSLTETVEPVLHGRGVEDHLVVISEPDGRKHPMHGVLEFRSGLQGRGELRCMHHGGEHRGDVAVGRLEGLRHLLHQRIRRAVRNEVSRDLLRQMRRRCRVVHQDIDRFVHFSEASALDLVSKEGLVAVVVARRIEFECAFAQQLRLQLGFEFRLFRFRIDTDAGENPRQSLDIGLRIAGADTHGVQFHDLAGVVLVQMAGGVVGIVEITQHRRMA